MNFRSTIEKVLVSLSVVLLGACTAMPGPNTPTMPDADFVKAAPAERASYLKAIADEATALVSKKDAEYAVGRPIYNGNEKTGYTLQWDKKLSLLYIYPGHNPGAMSLETQGVLALRTDAHGNIFYQKDGQGVERPTTLLANVATQEGLGRVFLKGGFQVLSAGANGALAAKITSDAQCKEGCGDTWNIQGGTALAQGGAAVSVSQGGSSAAGATSGSSALSTVNTTSSGGSGGCATCAPIN